MTTAALPAGCHSHVVDVAGTRLHYVEAGEGPLVLLVHGFPESWYSWRHQLPALAAAGYRAVAIDVRGYGRSSTAARRRGLPHGAPRRRQRRPRRRARRGAGGGRRPRLGRADRLDLGAAAARRVHRGRRALGAVLAAVGASPARASSARWPATRSSTSSTSRSPAGPRPRSRPTSATGCAASCSPPRATPRRPTRPQGTVATIPHGAQHEGPLPPPGHDAGLADRGRPRRVRERVRAQRASAARSTGTATSTATGRISPPVRGRPIERAGAVRRRRPRRPDGLGCTGDRRASRTTLPKLHRSIILEGCGHWTQQERPDEVNEALLDFLGSVR